MTKEAPRLMRRSSIGIIVQTLPGAARATSRGGEEGTGRAVDLSGRTDRLAGLVPSIVTLTQLISRMDARDQAGRFSAGPGSAPTRSAAAPGEQSECLRHAASAAAGAGLKAGHGRKVSQRLWA